MGDRLTEIEGEKTVEKTVLIKNTETVAPEKTRKRSQNREGGDQR